MDAVSGVDMENQYEQAYNMILELQQEILSQPSGLPELPDYRLVNALSATHLLQDYLAQRIAEVGASSEGEDSEFLSVLKTAARQKTVDIYHGIVIY